MATNKEETASFVVRFNQKIFHTDAGEPQVQWRGNIRHVQGGDEKRFSEFEDVMQFIQGKLQDLTMIATEDKTPEEQEGILEKSFNIWKKVAKNTPKMVMETIKDPKKGIAQIQQQITEVGDELGQKLEQQFEEKTGRKLEIDEWRGPSKTDHKEMMDMMTKMAKEITALNKKVNTLSKKVK